MIYRAGYYQPYKNTALYDGCGLGASSSLLQKFRYHEGTISHFGDISSSTNYVMMQYYGAQISDPADSSASSGEAAFALLASQNEKTWEGVPGIFRITEDIDSSTLSASDAAFMEAFMDDCLQVIFYMSDSSTTNPSFTNCRNEVISSLNAGQASCITFKPYFILIIETTGSMWSGSSNFYSSFSLYPYTSSNGGFNADTPSFDISSIQFVWNDSYPGNQTPISYNLDVTAAGKTYRAVSEQGDTSFGDDGSITNVIQQSNGSTYTLEPIIWIYDGYLNICVAKNSHYSHITTGVNITGGYNAVKCNGYVFTDNEGIWLTDAVLNQLNYTEVPTLQFEGATAETIEGQSYKFTGHSYIINCYDYVNMSPQVYNSATHKVSIGGFGASYIFADGTSQSINRIDVEWQSPYIGMPAWTAKFYYGNNLLFSRSIYDSSVYVKEKFNINYVSSTLSTQQKSVFDELFKEPTCMISGKWKHTNSIYTDIKQQDIRGTVIFKNNPYQNGTYNFTAIECDTSGEPYINFYNNSSVVAHTPAHSVYGSTTVDFGDQEQEVSSTFYEWFTSSFTEVEEEPVVMVPISGVWEHCYSWSESEYISTEAISGTVTYRMDSYIQEIGVFQFNRIEVDGLAEPYIRYYDSTNNVVCAYPIHSGGTFDGTIVDFGETQQTVSEKFYNWFTTHFQLRTKTVQGLMQRTSPYTTGTTVTQYYILGKVGESLDAMESFTRMEYRYEGWHLYEFNTSVTKTYNADSSQILFIDFGETPQYVSDEFYNLITTAFTRIGDSDPDIPDEPEVPDNSINDAFTALADSIRAKASVTGLLSLVRMIQVLNALPSHYGTENSEYDSTNFDSVMYKLARVIRLKNNTTDALNLLEMPTAVNAIDIVDTNNITFYIDNTSYTVAEGTTWSEWIHSGTAPDWLEIRESPNGSFYGVYNVTDQLFIMTSPADGPYYYNAFVSDSTPIEADYSYWSYGAPEREPTTICWYPDCSNEAISSIELSAGDAIYIYYCAEHEPDYCTAHRTYGLASEGWYCPECHTAEGHTYAYYDGCGSGPTEGIAPSEVWCQICTVCRHVTDHTYTYQTDGSVVCTTCNESCPHNSFGEDGICYTCGLCTHEYPGNGDWYEYEDGKKIHYLSCLLCQNTFIVGTEICLHDTSSTYSYSTGVPDSGGELAGLWHTTYTNCACGEMTSRGMGRCEAADNSSNCKYCGADTSPYYMGVCGKCEYYPNSFCSKCGNYHCSNCSCN